MHEEHLLGVSAYRPVENPGDFEGGLTGGIEHPSRRSDAPEDPGRRSDDPESTGGRSDAPEDLGRRSDDPEGDGFSSCKGWYRRNLPHRDESGLFQFITYRLADSVPSDLLFQIEDEIKSVPACRMEAERRKKIEALLDIGHGSGVLRDPRAAECVIENWSNFADRRYSLIAWVVMPTHVHVLIRQYDGESLPKIIQSWKTYTGKRLKALFPQTCVKGEFWKREYWDRYIRDETHFYNAIAYIRDNPVKAHLVNSAEEWPYLQIPIFWGEEHPSGRSDAPEDSHLPSGNSERLLGEN